MNQYTNETQETKEKRARNKVAMYAPSFEYAGNYGGSEGYVDIRCKVCGTVQSKAMITLRQRHARCEVCYRKEIEADRAKKRQAKEQRKEERAERAERAAWNRYERSIKQERFAVCKRCGGLFQTTKANAVYCSSECFKREVNSSHKDKRIDRLSAVVVDKDIRLDRLAKRDRNICTLCGKPVDWEDCFTREDGTFIAGDWYPSIDHIVPLSLGGKQSWDNVQLTHRRCNYLKSNNPHPQKVLNAGNTDCRGGKE